MNSSALLLNFVIAVQVCGLTFIFGKVMSALHMHGMLSVMYTICPQHVECCERHLARAFAHYCSCTDVKLSMIVRKNM